MKVENLLIKLVSDVHTGTSVTTGRGWSNRNILLAFEDETGEGYMNAVVDEDLWKTLNLREGDIASLNLRFRTKRYQSGFVTNDIRIINPQN